MQLSSKNHPKFNLVLIQELIYLKKMNLDEDKSIGTHWIAMYFNNNNISYFDSFGVEHIPKEI